MSNENEKKNQDNQPIKSPTKKKAKNKDIEKTKKYKIKTKKHPKIKKIIKITLLQYYL